MHRSLPAPAVALLCALSAVAALFGPSGATEAGVEPPQPPDAAPADLTGLWTNASYTRLQRPKALKSLVITPEEALAFEAPLARSHGVPALSEDKLGQVESEFNDSGEGLARIHGQIRTSWIVDPADGQVPYTPEAKAFRDAPNRYDNPEDLSGSARCLTANGSAPPQMSAMDTNLVQIIQTRDYVVLLSEKNHDVRVVSLDQPKDTRQPPSWSGNSVGHWEGGTLVVETTGFRDRRVDRAAFNFSSQAIIEERFTRSSPTEIIYSFKVTDPATFSRPWSGEMIFTADKGPMYEFACHEGNYSLPSILRAARLGRQAPPPAAAKPAK